MVVAMLTRLLRTAFRLRVEGEVRELTAAGPLLIVANHPGPLDPWVLATVFGEDAVVMSSQASARHCLCRWLLRGREVHEVDWSLATSVRRLARQVAQGHRVVVFPENRPISPGSAGKLYQAPAIVAARTGVRILPINIRYGSVGAGGRPGRGITVTVGKLTRIELEAGLPARERRRQATDRMLSLLQLTQVLARPRQTLFDALVDAAEQNGRSTAIVEDSRQIEESYGTVLKMSLALGRLLARETPQGAVVGVLLPNTAAAVGTLFGLSAMGRIPAMLNYSSGPDAVLASVDASGVRVVVTSRRFVELARLDRLLKAIGHCRIIYLEELREQLRVTDKLWLVFWALRFPRRATSRGRHDDVALVLFTSGSEGKPKGVALSHDAALANMAQLAAAIDFCAADKFLNALPMYHTYGLIACTLMPLCYGTKLFLYTNPLHYRIIPEIAYSRRCTYLFGTSTFLGNYARQARPLDFASVRYVISGGEKLNPEVQRIYHEKFGLRVLEGYGSTECGPAVSLATRERFRVGAVGRFLAGVDFRLVPVEGISEGGVLHVSSPNMMLGYFVLDRPGELQPARSELGPGWHCMGDVVSIDGDGYVCVLGRLKRFAKVAGEMVALEMVERLARECSSAHQHAATVAMSPDRGEITVLFTTDAELDRIRLHQAARRLGLQDLAVARSIVHVRSLPVLGSGKTDYVQLGELASAAAIHPSVRHAESMDERATGQAG